MPPQEIPEWAANHSQDGTAMTDRNQHSQIIQINVSFILHILFGGDSGNWGIQAYPQGLLGIFDQVFKSDLFGWKVRFGMFLDHFGVLSLAGRASR